MKKQIQILLFLILIITLVFPNPAEAILAETPGNTFETAAQLGLTGTDTTGRSGIQLTPKTDYFFWLTLDRTSDLTFTFFTKMQMTSDTIALRLYNLNKKAYGERTGKPKCASGSCKATLTLTSVPKGSYYLKVSYKNVSGASSNGFLTWRAANITGPLPWEPSIAAKKSNIAFGQMDSTTREHWYRYKFARSASSKTASLTITARSSYTVNIYSNENLKSTLAKTVVATPGSASQAATFQVPANRAADTFFIIQVVNSKGQNSEYTLVMK